MSALQPLEKTLSDLFVDKAPHLPAAGKNFLVQYLPWVNLVLGLLTLYAVWTLWQWATFADQLTQYANSINAAFGTPAAPAGGLGFVVWLGLGVLLIEAILYIMAFPATRARRKSGWNLMFYAVLLNVVYAVVMLFSGYGGIGSLLGSVIGTAVGLYLLFQIRGSYLGQPAAERKA
jgi:hypothetical protein